MKRMRIMGLSLVAVFAMSALVAGSASAATTLKLSTTGKGLLAPGANLVASSSNLKFHTAAGDLNCTSNILTGTLTTNSASKDKGSITAESSTGPFAGGACETTTPLGITTIVSGGFPWPVEFTTKGTATVKGTKKVAFTSTFPEAGGAKCIYEAAKVLATFKVGGPVEPLTTTATTFKAGKGSNVACPKSGVLTGEFEVKSGGETINSSL